MRRALLIASALLGCSSQGMKMAPMSTDPAPLASPVASSSADASSPLSPSAEPLVGRWVGTGIQNDGQMWDIQVDIVSDRGVCAKARYPSVPCAADWVCTEARGGILTAVEHLTAGQNRCIDGGTLTFTLKGELDAEWAWSKDGTWAHASLRKETHGKRK